MTFPYLYIQPDILSLFHFYFSSFFEDFFVPPDFSVLFLLFESVLKSFWNQSQFFSLLVPYCDFHLSDDPYAYSFLSNEVRNTVKLPLQPVRRLLLSLLVFEKSVKSDRYDPELHNSISIPVSAALREINHS